VCLAFAYFFNSIRTIPNWTIFNEQQPHGTTPKRATANKTIANQSNANFLLCNLPVV